MALQLIPMLIMGVVRLATPTVARALAKQGFKKAGKAAVKKAGNTAKKIKPQEVLKIVRETSSKSKPRNRLQALKNIDKPKSKIIKAKPKSKVKVKKKDPDADLGPVIQPKPGSEKALRDAAYIKKYNPKKIKPRDKPKDKPKTKRPVIKVPASPAPKPMKGKKAIIGTIGTLGAGAAIGAIGEKLSKQKPTKKPRTRQQILRDRKSVSGPTSKNSFKPRTTRTPVAKVKSKIVARPPQLDSGPKSKETKPRVRSAQEKRLSKIASQNIAATQSSTKRPVSIKAESGKGLGTLSEIASKYGTTVKELMKANKDITDADVIQKGQKIQLGKVVKNRKSVYQKKKGGTVYRRGGGKALRGFGKATYSNKPY